jgi:hypothetical protein
MGRAVNMERKEWEKCVEGMVREKEKMEKIKHTPGPWHYKKDGFRITIGNASTRHDYLEHNYTVAIITDNSIQAEANARAISSLPDLLEACKWALAAEKALPEGMRHPRLERALDAAIAKAEDKG